MSKKYEIVSIKDTVLANVSDVELGLKLNDDGSYELKNYDEYLEMVDELGQAVDEYVFSEEDRGDIRTLGSSINKINKEIKDEIKNRETILFGRVHEQRKELEEKLKDLRSRVVRGRDEQDERDKREKYEMLESRFEDMKFHMENLTDSDLQFTDVFESRWLNRSASENKVDEELEKRMSSIDAVLGSSLLPDGVDKNMIVKTLKSTDWEGLRAITQIDEDITRRKMELEEERIRKQIEEEKRKAREEQLKNDEISQKQYEKEIGFTKVQFTVLQKDLDRVKELLDENDIEYSMFE